MDSLAKTKPKTEDAATVAAAEEKSVSSVDKSPANTQNDNTGTDEFVVDWDGDDDPQNPLNWPSSKKTIVIVLISSLTFVT